jgi:hypothetical protein
MSTNIQHKSMMTMNKEEVEEEEVLALAHLHSETVDLHLDLKNPATTHLHHGEDLKAPQASEEKWKNLPFNQALHLINSNVAHPLTGNLTQLSPPQSQLEVIKPLMTTFNMESQ